MRPIGRGREAEALFSQKRPEILKLEPDQHSLLPLVHLDIEFYECAIDSLILATPIRIHSRSLAIPAANCTCGLHDTVDCLCTRIFRPMIKKSRQADSGGDTMNPPRQSGGGMCASGQTQTLPGDRNFA
jgi:hypothetical protein